MVKSHFLCVVFSVCLCCTAHGGPGLYTPDELLTMVTAQKSRIESIEYAYSHALSTDHLDAAEQKRISSSGVVGVEHLEFGQEGPKRYMNQRYHMNPQATTGFGEERLTFDGMVGTRYFPKEAQAEIKEDVYDHMYTGDHFMSALLMHESTGTDITTVLSEDSLVGMLACEDASVRSETEQVDGRDCHVVDVKHRGQVLRTVYIDVQRGCLPLKSMKYRVTDEGRQELTAEYHLTDVRDFGTGLWFPLQADRTAAIRTGRDESAPLVALKYALRVNSDENGRPALRVNHDIPDEKFKPHFAMRTHVYDRVVDSFYLVGTTSAPDLDQFVEERIELARQEGLPIEQFAQTSRDEPADGNEPVSDAVEEDGVGAATIVKNREEGSHALIVGVVVVAAAIAAAAVVNTMIKRRRGAGSDV